ncbi:hypothetical protein Rhal01_03222 [Rubritalea halochordaticola]|uniref:PDZ domain-containing protein n=2 Tax=Rubritalea halochordaticola TaxID=714537 RepID=A0ABP9V578_9BACT
MAPTEPALRNLLLLTMSDTQTIPCACPNCGKVFQLDASMLGRKGRCDSCQTKFMIEETPQPRVQAPVPQLASGKSSGGLGLTVVALLIAGGAGYYFMNRDALAPSESTSSGSARTTEAVPADLVEGSPAEKVVDMKGQTGPALPPLEKSFPVVKSFKDLDIRQYLKTYPNVHMGWMPSKPEQADEARGWGHHLGPLGVRVRPYVPQHQNRPAFAANVPDCLRGQDGRLALTAAEVVTIAPGSPAEGQLQEGDLIIGIEGEMLKSGSKYRPDWEFMHKDARELQLMLGEKLDQAQGRGDVRLTVMRYPNEVETVFSEEMKQADGKRELAATPVSEGDEIHLIVDKKDRNDYDHFSWLSPSLSGPSGTLDLTDEAKVQPASATTGWGKVTRGADLTGKAIAEPCLSVHGDSKLVFKVPAGYDSFRTGMQATHDRGDLKAEVKIVKARQALPVVRTQLWQGAGGNQSVGAQSFSVEIQGEGMLTLESSQFDNNIHGDGTRWCDLVVEGDYGKKSLLEMPWEAISSGYGRPSVDLEKPFTFQDKSYQQSLDLHAQGEVSWLLPAGTKRVSGVFIPVSYGKVQPKVHLTNDALPLTGIHQQKVVELRFPIGKAGSYSATYPRDCKKTKITAARHVEWLAAQQSENGTWPRLAGYTTEGWDTSWCGLALMSSGDAKYDEQVKKAAYWVAYAGAPGEWTAERAMRLIFLSEYYLRTKDEKILAGVQAAYYQLIDVCKNDYMAGHKVNGFGYGIAGQHYGTGHLALGVALAARTPITVDQELVGNILRHAGEVCVNGTYAYGRGRRMLRDDSRRHGGGNAMVGPGILGVQIGGGHRTAVKEAVERWEASIGDGDNSHATSSLAYIFASLAMAAADEEVFLKHMQNFRYKMTIDDNWEGGFLKSAFPLDFQGGEGVTSQWIRSAGSILVLNALKHNLAITGKKELMAKEKLDSVAVSEWGGQVHSYYLRNWCLANELLGRKAPPKLAKGIERLAKLERDITLVPETKELVTQLAPELIRSIAADKSLDAMQRGYAIELLCGLNFQVSTELKGDKQVVDLNVYLPLQQLNWLEKDKESFFASSPFHLTADVIIQGENLNKPIEFKVSSLKGFNFDMGSRKFSASTGLKNASKKEFDGAAWIRFTVGDTQITYKRPMTFNTLLVTKNEVNYRRMNLKLKTGPRAYFQSQPLVISGIAFDCMYPIETTPPVTSPIGQLVNVHEGDEVLVNVGSDNMICGTVYSLSYDKPSQVTHVPAATRTMVRGQVAGDMAAWVDHEESSAIIKMDDGKAVLEYDFGKPVAINGLDVKDARAFIRVWYHDGSHWVPLVWDNYSTNTNHHPVFPETKAQRWRLEFHGRDLKLKTLRFYHNPHTLMPRQPLAQSKDAKYLPPIQPE